MAIKLYEKDINKNVDWGGDESTNGLPVSGEKIQKFIKESLNGKFGFMYYDKDPEGRESSTGVNVVNHTPTNQYIVFSDADDFALWAANPAEGSSYVLARFDAPAPATIEITENSSDLNTILLSDIDNQNLSFTCVVKDKSNNIVTDTCSVSISISNTVSGNVVLPTYNPTEQGKSFTFNFNGLLSNKLGTYLTEGVNIVRCTITSMLFNVSTTISFQYRVLNLNLTSNFDDNLQQFNCYSTISLKNSTGFETTITASGTGQKFLRVFIDGERINVLSDDRHVNELYLGANNPELVNVVIPFADVNDDLYEWATEGKHSLQMYFYIKDNNDNEIKSQTLYYDFVLVDNNTIERSYILFKRVFENNSFEDINPEDSSILPANTNLTINTEQYLSFSTDYIVLDTFGRGSNADGSAIIVNIEIYDKTNLITPEFTLPQAIPSGTGSTFSYTAQNYGDKLLVISSTVATQNGIADSTTTNLNIKESDVKAKKATSGLELELSALNRSNTENEEDRNKWSYVKTTGLNPIPYEAVFNNVLWNTQNGWINNCLVLNNGATVTIPMNIFGQGGGVTFEIDFETENVQDDNAVIMKYGAEDGAGIFINACNATLQSNNGINIHTNYKDGARQKIQFIFGYNQQADQETLNRFDCPYLMYMVVNGILDRVAQFKTDDSYIGTSEDYNQFVIGNMDGKVTTKIHSIRVYTRPLTLDECVDNYIADSSEVRRNFLRNDIYNEDGKTINISKVLSADLHIPVMTVYGDVMDSIVQVFDKKANVPVDILYQDPNFPEFNYFARDAWMSNQGTSSMNYPRRNFRPYFNKAADSKTLRGHASNDRYKYETRVWWGLTDTETIAKIQQGLINIDEPIVVNGTTYNALRNKKTLKKKPQLIDYKTAIMFVHSGIKIYSDQACKSAIKNLNAYNEENPEGPIYVQGAYARYKHKDLYTDRWTLKCDYAESSMTHNAGVGRLWGDVMRDVEIGSEGFTYDIDGSEIPASKPGMTNAQRAVAAYNETHPDINDGYGFGDIRTSCDGYPIIIINRPRIKNGNAFTEQYGDPIFLGLYNIMTDKGSTPLFGFEDLKDEDGNKIFDASKCECWECLQNGSNIAQMNDIVTDDSDGSTAPYTSLFDADGKFIADTGSDNEDRPIFASYEARWPDNDDLNDTCTNNLETVIRFVNFCKDGVSVTVDGKDGYTLSDFTAITEEEAAALWESGDYKNLANGTLYLGVPATSYKNKTESFYAKDSDGATLYDEALRPVLIEKEEAANSLLYKKGKPIIYYKQTYAAQNVTGMSFEQIFNEDDTDTVKINSIYAVLQGNKSPYVYTAEEDDSQIEHVPTDYYPNSGYTWYYYDKTYDRANVSKVVNTAELSDEVYTGRVFTYDGKRLNSENEQLHPDAWVTVYLKRNGNNYTYKNEMGDEVMYSSGEEIVTVTGNGHAGVVSKGSSFKGHTLFEYFQDQKYEHFDVWKLACYYIYIMRFAAVDQVIKNTMMTTEDGIHYYYINYDNDTVLGVRNDGYLVYDWQVDRNTYDSSIGGYAYAGFGSVLWNLLEQDQDFMDKVQTVAKAMVTSNVLTYDIAVDMFNNKQSGTWSQRLYNQSEMYKYIGIFNDIDNLGTDDYNPYQNTKYLPFLQGSRASHRDWWLRHRFDLYDAKWSAGEYEKAKLEVYMSATASPSSPADICRIITGSKFYYTVLSNGRLLGNNFVELENNVEHIFRTSSPLAIGDPLALLGGYNIKVLDFSEQRDRLGSSLAFNWDEKKFTSKMTQLILGGDTPTTLQPGCSLGNIVNLGKLKALEVLDIRTAYNIKSVEISNLANLRKFLAEGSAITNFAPAKGAILEEVSLPNSITTLRLKEITLNDLTFKPGIALTKVEIVDIEGSALEGNKLFDFILDWYITLKLANVRMTDYSCTLSFNKIELEQYYGDENGEVIEDITEWINSIRTAGNIEHSGKKIKSLALLNAIKKDFGLDNTGSENFKITKGVIKLYGDNEETGGLTLENYDTLTTEKYNDTIKLWSDAWFRSDNPYHFDSNSSVFVSIEPYDENYKQPKYENGEYTIIAGQKVRIKTTIFPIDNERIIDIIPSSIDPARGIEVNWSLNTNTGNRESSFGLSGGQRSTLYNDNGTATLEIYEYTDNSPKTMHVSITDSKILNAAGRPSEVAYLTINIENMVRPNYNNMVFTTLPDDGTPGIVVNRTSTQQIDVVKEYKYVLSFNINNINVDINSVKGSFNSNTIVEESEYGTLSTYFDELLGNYVMTYIPDIQQNDTNVQIYMFVELNDKNKTVINNFFNVQLNTTDIDNITLSYKGTDLEVQEDNSLLIEHYVKNESEITLNARNQKVVKYSYKVNINPDTYNIPIKSMNIVVPDELITRYDIVKNMSESDANVINSIDIILPVGKDSLYQNGEFDIIITDKYDNVISRKVNVILGYFLPNGIDVVKTITTGGVNEYYVNENVNSTSILTGDFPTFTYTLFTYSMISGIKYIWCNADEINYIQNTIYNNVTNVRFIPEEYCTNAICSGFTTDKIFPCEDESDDATNLRTWIVNLSDNNTFAQNIYKQISFELKSTATGLFTTGGTITYSASFNNVTAKLVNYAISIQRIPAIAISFDINNSNIKAYYVGDGIENTSSNASECMYILDRYLNLYTLTGYQEQKQALGLTNEGVRNYFVALVFVYINENGARKYTSLDPWKVAENRGYMWWDFDSTWANDTSNGAQFSKQSAFYYLLSGDIANENLHGDTNNIYTYYQNVSEGHLFKTWYDYYRILCSRFQNSRDGGTFTLQYNDTYVNQTSELGEICAEFYNGNVTFSTSTDNRVIDSRMIFYYIDDYVNMGMTNVVCMPLSVIDYVNIMTHYDIFTTYLNELAPNSNLHELLFDMNKYQIDEGEDWDDILSMIYDQDPINSKLFWYFNIPTLDSEANGYKNKETLQITNRLSGGNPGIDYRINDRVGESRRSPDSFAYCLFGPKL